LSIPWARKQAYEVFANIHIFFAIAYVALFHWHIYGEFMSVSAISFPPTVASTHTHITPQPNFCYATLAVWALSALLRASTTRTS
jgi:hypothetical protein